jgi:hypothetical protein
MNDKTPSFLLLMVVFLPRLEKTRFNHKQEVGSGELLFSPCSHHSLYFSRQLDNKGHKNIFEDVHFWVYLCICYCERE